MVLHHHHHQQFITFPIKPCAARSKQQRWYGALHSVSPLRFDTYAHQRIDMTGEYGLSQDCQVSVAGRKHLQRDIYFERNSTALKIIPLDIYCPRTMRLAMRIAYPTLIEVSIATWATKY